MENMTIVEEAAPFMLVTCAACSAYWLIADSENCPRCGSEEYGEMEPVWPVG